MKKRRTLEYIPTMEEQKAWFKKNKKLIDRAFKKSLEQSKTPNEEQARHIHSTCEKCKPSCCYPFCKVYVGEPKTEAVSETVENMEINDAIINAKTEDTGECKCSQCKISEQLDNLEKDMPKLAEPTVPLNKDWSDRFDEKFGQLFDYYYDRYEGGSFSEGENVKQFISQEIESARASERESLIKKLKGQWGERIDEVKGGLDATYGSSHNYHPNYEGIFDELLSKLEK